MAVNALTIRCANDDDDLPTFVGLNIIDNATAGSFHADLYPFRRGSSQSAPMPLSPEDVLLIAALVKARRRVEVHPAQHLASRLCLLDVCHEHGGIVDPLGVDAARRPQGGGLRFGQVRWWGSGSWRVMIISSRLAEGWGSFGLEHLSEAERKRKREHAQETDGGAKRRKS